MKVLAIDPGIRNLAMCIMSGTNENLEIELWNNYNVLEDDDHKCVSLQKNGNVCNKKCSMKFVSDELITFTCKTHFPKDITPNRNNKYKKKNIKNYLLQDIAKHFIQEVNKIHELNKELFSTIDCVIIELQPKINQKLKFISHLLYGKLTEIFMGTETTIRFTAAKNKLKAYTGPVIECKLKGAYAQRKWLSVQYTKWFLENKLCIEQRDIWMPVLLEGTKSDDKSDVFLYCHNSICGIPKKQLMSFKKKNLK